MAATLYRLVYIAGLQTTKLLQYTFIACTINISEQAVRDSQAFDFAFTDIAGAHVFLKFR